MIEDCAESFSGVGFSGHNDAEALTHPRLALTILLLRTGAPDPNIYFQGESLLVWRHQSGYRVWRGYRYGPEFRNLEVHEVCSEGIPCSGMSRFPHPSLNCLSVLTLYLSHRVPIEARLDYLKRLCKVTLSALNLNSKTSNPTLTLTIALTLLPSTVYCCCVTDEFSFGQWPQSPHFETSKNRS